VSSSASQQQLLTTSTLTTAPTSTLFATKREGRQWNFNEGQGPWGLKKNAEIWNGRLAQVRNHRCERLVVMIIHSVCTHGRNSMKMVIEDTRIPDD
jgi:hypothetical protein